MKTLLTALLLSFSMGAIAHDNAMPEEVLEPGVHEVATGMSMSIMVIPYVAPVAKAMDDSIMMRDDSPLVMDAMK